MKQFPSEITDLLADRSRYEQSVKCLERSSHFRIAAVENIAKIDKQLKQYMPVIMEVLHEDIQCNHDHSIYNNNPCIDI